MNTTTSILNADVVVVYIDVTIDANVDVDVVFDVAVESMSILVLVDVLVLKLMLIARHKQILCDSWAQFFLHIFQFCFVSCGFF